MGTFGKASINNLTPHSPPARSNGANLQPVNTCTDGHGCCPYASNIGEVERNLNNGFHYEQV
ncbi:MAG: hypothetical protein ABI760_08435 [Ferruginibacter sp.]